MTRSDAQQIWVSLTILSALFLSLTCAAEHSDRVAPTEIDQRVVAALPSRQGAVATLIKHLDLTDAFATRSQWTFVAAILPGSHQDGASEAPEDGGALVQCWVKRATPHCTSSMASAGLVADYVTPIHLLSAKIFVGEDGPEHSMLVVKSAGSFSADGSHAIYTALTAYNPSRDQFEVVFENKTGSNGNQETRYIGAGPLRGDVIVAEPTSDAPYGYWISVYSPHVRSGYAQILRYRSATHYGDGNPLAVIDSEMPGILRHLGLWKRGDPLPVSPGCPRPVLRHGALWCH